MKLGIVSWLGLFFISNCFKCARCYDATDYEIFDLVEEVNENFYDLFGIDAKASTSEIKRAYRRLAVKYHPDKNSDEGSEKVFRQIAAVYDVLKDDEKRQRYDIVLQTGLPNWKQPVFYYRRVRKLGLTEIAVILTLILTVGHFLVMWASYFERRYVVEELFRSHQKKDKRLKGRNRAHILEEKELELEEELERELSLIPRPRLTHLLPCKLVEWTWLALLYAVHTPTRLREWRKEQEEQRQLEQLEREEEERRREELNRLHEASKNKKRVNLAELRAEMMTSQPDDKPVIYGILQDELNETERSSIQHELKKAGEEWSDEELSLLAKAAVKFPSGTPQRWQKIAEVLQRPVKEVTEMANNLKQSYSKSVDAKAQGITGALEEMSNRTIINYEDITQASLEDSDGLVSSAVISAGNAAVRRRRKRHRIEETAISRLPGVQNPPKENGTVPKDSVQMRTQSQPATESHTVQTAVSPAMDVRANSSNASRTLWTQEQQKLLEQALVRYPRGTANRWDVIAECIPGKTKEDCIIRFKYLAEVVRKKKEQQTAK